MPTPKQKAANRRNAKHSTGPKTAEGKATSRLNALRHGLSAQTLVLPFESQTDFDALEQSLIHDLNPQGPAETLLVKRFAQKHWLAQRLTYTERGWLNTLLKAAHRIAVTGAEAQGKTPNPTPDLYEGLALTMQEAPCDPDDLMHKNFFRYRSLTDNEYQRALRALERARLIGPNRRLTLTKEKENPENGFVREPSIKQAA